MIKTKNVFLALLLETFEEEKESRKNSSGRKEELEEVKKQEHIA